MTTFTAHRGQVVSVTYSVTDNHGAVLERSQFPICYVHGGKSELFPEVEAALEGKQIGDKVLVTLAPDQAFGIYDSSLVFTDELSNVPEEFHKIGTLVPMESDDSEIKNFRVIRIEDGILTIDGNEPYAGKTVTFHVTIAGIRPATQQELVSGNAIEVGSTTLQ